MVRSVTERVDRGISWLDKCNVVPYNWRSLLNLDGLRFADPDRGPIGQLFNGHYYHALNKIGMIGGGSEFGFRTEHNQAFDSRELKEAWLKALHTDKEWKKGNNSIYKKILGTTFSLVNIEHGRVSIIVTKNPGKAKLLPTSYANIDSAKRHIRKLVQEKKV